MCNANVVGTTRGAPPETRAAARGTGVAAPMTGRRRWPAVLVVLGLAVQLAPVLLLPLALTQDGPAHVYGAWVLRHHGDGGAVGDTLRSAFTIDLSPVPNMLTTLLMAGLLGVLGADAAEKTVVAGFVLLLVAGTAYALRGVDRRAGWLAVAALPLAGSQLVAFGFYNFCWGVALALFVIGLALRRRAGWDIGRTLGAAALLGLTWSAHLLPWLLAVAVLGALALGRWTVAVRGGARAGGAAATHLLPPVLATFPTVALTLGYVLRGGGEHGAVGGLPGAARLAWLLTLYRPLVVSSGWELLPAAAAAAVLVSLGVAALRRRPQLGAEQRPGGTEAAMARADRIV